MLHMRIWRTNAHTNETNANPRQNHRTRPIRAPAQRRSFPASPRTATSQDLHCTSPRTRAFWALTYQPRGINPSTGKRWGGGVRHELGDAMLMTVEEARTAALAAKALVRQGGSPHHEAMASTASAVAREPVLPSTVDEALDAYATALMNRRQPSEATRRKSIHYARKAIRLMKAESAHPRRSSAQQWCASCSKP